MESCVKFDIYIFSRDYKTVSSFMKISKTVTLICTDIAIYIVALLANVEKDHWQISIFKVAKTIFRL